MPYATKEWENWGVGEWVSLFLKMTNPLLEAMRSKGKGPTTPIRTMAAGEGSALLFTPSTVSRWSSAV